MAHNHLYESPNPDIRLTPPEPSDWPTYEQVEKDYPTLCSEEHVDIYYGRIEEARRKKYGTDNEV